MGQTFSKKIVAASWGEGERGQLGLDNRNEAKTEINAASVIKTWNIEGSSFSELPDKEDIHALSCGGQHSMILTNEGNLFAFGCNEFGQLGYDYVNYILTATRVFINTKVIKVSCGLYHSAIIDERRLLYTTGNNANGQLGLGDTEDRNTFTKLGKQDLFMDVSCGYHHTCALSVECKVYCWGLGLNGRLGHGRETDCWLPVLAGVEEACIEVAAGGHHSAAITVSNNLVLWGSGSFGKLGNGSEKHEKMPRKVKGLENNVVSVSLGVQTSACTTKDCKLYTWGKGGSLGLNRNQLLEEDEYEPRNVTLIKGNIRKVSCGLFHMCAITDDGLLCVWDNQLEAATLITPPNSKLIIFM